MKNVKNILELIQIAECHKYYSNKEIELFNKDPGNWKENCKCNWKSVIETPETHPERLHTNGPWTESHPPSYSDIQEAYAEEITTIIKYWLENNEGQTIPINEEYLSTIKDNS
jgi:hypothetical protein